MIILRTDFVRNLFFFVASKIGWGFQSQLWPWVPSLNNQPAVLNELEAHGDAFSY